LLEETDKEAIVRIGGTEKAGHESLYRPGLNEAGFGRGRRHIVLEADPAFPFRVNLHDGGMDEDNRYLVGGR
jgi:hypothetical protein